MNISFSLADGLENGPMNSLLEHFDDAGRARFMGIAAEIVRRGVAEQGNDALGSEREDACAHEAGHVILAAAVGIELRSACIHRAKLDPQFTRTTGIKTFWAGFTDAGDGMAITLESHIEADLVHAANMLAGFTAEMCLRHDRVRLSSSAAERATARMIADNIAVKTGDDPQALLTDVLLFLRDIFTKNEIALRAVARALDRDRRVSGDRLKALVADVQPVTTITLAHPRFGQPIAPTAIPLRVS
jgi:hypothetical protein